LHWLDLFAADIGSCPAQRFGSRFWAERETGETVQSWICLVSRGDGGNLEGECYPQFLDFIMSCFSSLKKKIGTCCVMIRGAC
jgi:hypothetical protein